MASTITYTCDNCGLEITDAQRRVSLDLNMIRPADRGIVLEHRDLHDACVTGPYVKTVLDSLKARTAAPG